MTAPGRAALLALAACLAGCAVDEKGNVYVYGEEGYEYLEGEHSDAEVLAWYEHGYAEGLKADTWQRCMRWGEMACLRWTDLSCLEGAEMGWEKIGNATFDRAVYYEALREGYGHGATKACAGIDYHPGRHMSIRTR